MEIKKRLRLKTEKIDGEEMVVMECATCHRRENVEADIAFCRVPNYFIKVFANCFMKKSADCTTYMQKVPLARNFF